MADSYSNVYAKFSAKLFKKRREQLKKKIQTISLFVCMGKITLLYLVFRISTKLSKL